MAVVIGYPSRAALDGAEAFETLPAKLPRRASHRAQQPGHLLGHPLTPREWEVLATSARTDAYKDVAAALGVSIQTVKNHLVHIFAKLGVTSRDGAFRAKGWLCVPDDAEVQAQANRERVSAELARLRREADALIEQIKAES